MMMMVDCDRNDDDDDVREGGVLRFIKNQFCRLLIQIILTIIYIFYKLILKIVSL